MSSSEREPPFVAARARSLRKKSAAVVLVPSPSSVLPFCGGDAVGGHEGFDGRFKGLVVDGGVEEGRGDVAEGGVEAAVPPPRKRRTPFMSFCGSVAQSWRGKAGYAACC